MKYFTMATETVGFSVWPFHRKGWLVLDLPPLIMLVYGKVL